MSKKALVIIDLQNDYFPEGKYPLWNTEQTLENIETAIELAKKDDALIVHVQHIADPAMGLAPFFNQGSEGAEIHPHIMAAAPEGEVVVKTFADSFHQTNLEQVLQQNGVTDLVLCGMMTQNCVTHTALSKAAEKYEVSVLVDATTTVDEMLHNIALHALSSRVPLVTKEQAFS
ncbi:cysteine hydrolase family protein [Vibrio ishigakensis]|uniref:cysteine hydrolase family protein n=1 Tax=Vibrio ishigakensis TaxID=1481914 RepID=UPI0021C36829|nr:cysteine hydrolase family protein [Vibrio ishigakensis]